MYFCRKLLTNFKIGLGDRIFWLKPMLRQRVVLVYGLFVSILQAGLICVFALFRPRAQFQEPFLVRGPGARGPGPSYRGPSRGSQTWVLGPGPGSWARVQGVLVQGPPPLVLG